MQWPPRRLRQDDNLVGFESGEPTVDGYLSTCAKLAEARNFNANWVVVDGEDFVVGFAAVVTRDIAPKLIDDQVPNLLRFPAPVLLLAQLGVRRDFQKRGVGEVLMRKVYEVAVETARTTGCVGVIVDALPGAVAYYLGRHGFAVVAPPKAPATPTRLFRSLASIAADLRPSDPASHTRD